jgi:hypothetical protein
MSFWPDGDVKEDFGFFNTFKNGVKSSLVFHHDLDRHYESKREPIIFEIDYVSMKKVNELYEEILDYNDITHDNVTLERAEEIIESKRKPEISLSRSLYSFQGTSFSSPDFYKYKQSCTTFSMGLLLNSGANKDCKNLTKLIENLSNRGDIDYEFMNKIQADFLLELSILKVKTFKNFLEKRFNFNPPEISQSCNIF